MKWYLGFGPLILIQVFIWTIFILFGLLKLFQNFTANVTV